MIDFGPNELSPMHRAVSIDYGVVLEGEFELILESGQKRIMRQGDVSIQRATAHQWKNITGAGNLPGRMMWFLVGINDLIINGTKLKTDMGAMARYYQDHEENPADEKVNEENK